MAVTLKDVAKAAGVSTSAVSRAFTIGASVSDKTRKKVEAAAEKLGYEPSFIARSLTTRRTKLIGLVSDNFRNPLFLQVFDLFTKTLQANGWRPLLVNLSEEVDPSASLKMLRQYQVDGVIVASSTLPLTFSKTFKDADIPVVHSFGKFSSVPDVHVIGIDNTQSGRMAAEHFKKLGYKSVGFMGGPAHATSTKDRWRGFREQLQLYPEITVSHSFAEAYSFEAGRNQMLENIATRDKQPLAEAYFCGDDVLSIGALSALQDAGLKVPDDVGVLGLNDMDMAAWQSINLTTIHQPVQQIIQSSVELIVALIEAPDRLPEARLFSTKIIERGTLRKLNDSS